MDIDKEDGEEQNRDEYEIETVAIHHAYDPNSSVNDVAMVVPWSIILWLQYYGLS